MFNQFSFVLLAAGVGILLFLGLRSWSRSSPALRVGMAVVYVAVIAAVLLAFRYPTEAVSVETPEQVEALINDNVPTFVMLYSNF